jgi:type III pantothenate kinase
MAAQARVVICNVAGSEVATSISSLLAGRHSQVSFLHASAEACGVRNTYEHPRQLGADRWAALIGARALSDSACLVVCAGTATTVDLLDAAGVFRGGLILPGFDLMRAALARNTAQLPLADGVFSLEPATPWTPSSAAACRRNSGRSSGCFPASPPSLVRPLPVDRRRRRASRGTPHHPLRVADNLILSGLVRYAESPGSFDPLRL